MAPLTNAERQRKYREKLKRDNQEKLEQLKKNTAERNKKNYMKINQLPENLQNEQRKRWRQQKQKQKQKTIDPQPAKNDEKERRKIRYTLSKENLKLKRTIGEMTRKIRALRKTVYRYKQKNNYLQHLQKTEKQCVCTLTKNTDETALTPCSKTATFLEQTNISTPDKERVKKVVFENFVLRDSISSQYFKAENNYERDILKKIANNDMVKKYKMKTNFQHSLGLQGRIRQRRISKQKKIKTMIEIKEFLEKDDNSRMTAGKKETKTFRKDKRQIRYMTDSLKKLHKKYKKEGGQASYATFVRYKPFYILDPKITQRNTCACAKHANLTFLARKLKILGILPTDDLHELVSSIVCNRFNKACMYDECKICSNKTISFDLAHKNSEAVVFWHAWVTKKHVYTKCDKSEGNVEKSTKRTTKEEVKGTITTLISSFSDQLKKFKKHYFNLYHQSKMYKKCKDTLTETEVIVNCDFSENYLCKMNEEIQATHFGASKKQCTLHTSVIYYKNEKGLQEKSFCTISPNNDHQPITIWAHLTPILKHIKIAMPKITTIHFFSDGPTTQYRQKNNFYLMDQMIRKLNFQSATWSYFESAHGKSAADGIGGSVKRTLDKKVAHGEDIIDAKTAYNSLMKTPSKIIFFYVSDEDIHKLELDVDLKDLIPVPNTMKIHQIIFTEHEDIIKYRTLSCFCRVASCNCFGLKEHNLKKLTPTDNEKPKKHKSKLPRRKKITKKLIEETATSEEDEQEIVYMATDDNEDIESNVDKANQEEVVVVQIHTTNEEYNNKKKKIVLKDNKTLKYIPARNTSQELTANELKEVPEIQDIIEIKRGNCLQNMESTSDKRNCTPKNDILIGKSDFREETQGKSKIFYTNDTVETVEECLETDNVDSFIVDSAGCLISDQELPSFLITDSAVAENIDITTDFSFSLLEPSPSTSRILTPIETNNDKINTEPKAESTNLKVKTTKRLKRKKIILNENKIKKKKYKNPVIKCAGCEDELISDVEEDEEKNIGCDVCPRWYHLKCTVNRGLPFEKGAVRGKDFDHSNSILSAIKFEDDSEDDDGSGTADNELDTGGCVPGKIPSVEEYLGDETGSQQAEDVTGLIIEEPSIWEVKEMHSPLREREREEASPSTGRARRSLAGASRGRARQRSTTPPRTTNDTQVNKFFCGTCCAKFKSLRSLNTHKRIHIAKTPFKCETCNATFTKAYQLKCHKLTHIGKKSFECEICNVKFAQLCNLKNHKRTHTDEKPFKCEICNAKFTAASKLKNHTRIHTGERPFECEICNAKFTGATNLKNHTRIHTDERPFLCEICNAKFKTAGHLKEHSRIHTGEKPYECETCDANFARAGDLKKHTRVHNGEKPFECEICNVKFTQVQSLKNHKRIHTGEKPFKCEICKAKFTFSCSLRFHIRTHTGERPFECEICDAKFTLSSNLRRHIRTHTGERPFECEICNGKFTVAGDLKRHIQTHSGARPFECEICNKKFTQASCLRMHTQIHTGRRPHICEICNKKFTQAATLRKHMQIHTGDRPVFTCEICNGKFTELCNLKQHTRIHTGEKPFECEICNAKFRTAGSLKCHTVTHTGERPFECEICNAKFARAGDVKSHARIHSGLRPFVCEICNAKFKTSGHLKRHKLIHTRKKM